MADINRRKFMTGTAAIATAAALPSVPAARVDAFRMTPLIFESPPCGGFSVPSSFINDAVQRVATCRWDASQVLRLVPVDIKVEVE